MSGYLNFIYIIIEYILSFGYIRLYSLDKHFSEIS